MVTTPLAIGSSLSHTHSTGTAQPTSASYTAGHGACRTHRQAPRPLATPTYLHDAVVDLQAPVFGRRPAVHDPGHEDSFTGRAILVVLGLKTHTVSAGASGQATQLTLQKQPKRQRSERGLFPQFLF